MPELNLDEIREHQRLHALGGTTFIEETVSKDLSALIAEVERLRAELDDLRHNLAERAFCAPDTDDAGMLASLDARIRDAYHRGNRAGRRFAEDDARAAVARVHAAVNGFCHGEQQYTEHERYCVPIIRALDGEEATDG